MSEIDAIQLNFNPASLQFLSLMLALVMFGVALDMRPDNFKQILRAPVAFGIGLFSQYVLLPAVAFTTTLALDTPASISLGILLVCTCPGGNVSNFFTHYSGGNAALSVSMSSVSTLACIVMTPLNFSFWATQREDTAALLQTIHIDPVAIMLQVLIILLLPCVLGMLLRHHRPQLADKLKRPCNIFSILLFIGFIGGGLAANWQIFMDYIGATFWIVVMVNAFALTAGYQFARLFGLGQAERKAVSFEVGIQNTGFGLILSFAFFSQLGGMALVNAWWGIWHLISGLVLASLWRRRSKLQAGATIGA